MLLRRAARICNIKHRSCEQVSNEGLRCFVLGACCGLANPNLQHIKPGLSQAGSPRQGALFILVSWWRCAVVGNNFS